MVRVDMKKATNNKTLEVTAFTKGGRNVTKNINFSFCRPNKLFTRIPRKLLATP